MKITSLKICLSMASSGVIAAGFTGVPVRQRRWASDASCEASPFGHKRAMERCDVSGGFSWISHEFSHSNHLDYASFFGTSNYCDSPQNCSMAPWPLGKGGQELLENELRAHLVDLVDYHSPSDNASYHPCSDQSNQIVDSLRIKTGRF